MLLSSNLIVRVKIKPIESRMNLNFSADKNRIFRLLPFLVLVCLKMTILLKYLKFNLFNDWLFNT